MDFNFEKIKKLLENYQELVKGNGFKKEMVNNFLNELRDIGGYLKGTNKLSDNRIRFIIIGLKKESENDNTKVCYIIDILDLYNGNFVYKEDIAHYRYVLPTEDEVEKYNKLKVNIYMINNKIRKFEHKMEIVRLFEEER